MSKPNSSADATTFTNDGSSTNRKSFLSKKCVIISMNPNVAPYVGYKLALKAKSTSTDRRQDG